MAERIDAYAEHCPEGRPFYDIDFAAMSPEERYELMSRPQDDMEACLEDEPLEVQRLALTLVFTRWWNSYKHMAPEEPTPEIIGTAIELLWDFLEGKCGDKDFSRFQKSFIDSAYKVVFQDDRSLKKDPESEAFYQAHCSQWKSKSYNNFFIWLAALLENIAEKDGCSLYWLPVEYLLFNDIAEGMIDFFEKVYQGAQVNPNDPLSGLRRREREIYNTPTFCRVIALLQQDMRTALSDTPLAAPADGPEMALCGLLRPPGYLYPTPVLLGPHGPSRGRTGVFFPGPSCGPVGWSAGRGVPGPDGFTAIFSFCLSRPDRR